jgi:hypothetical protein
MAEAQMLRSAFASVMGSMAREYWPVPGPGGGPPRPQFGGLESTTPQTAPGSAAELAEVVAQFQPPSDHPLALSRAAAAPAAVVPDIPEPIPPAVLAQDFEEVFRRVRARIDATFRFNLWLAIAVAVVLLGAVAGAFVSAVVYQNAIWASVFGGISVADMIGAYIWMPGKVLIRALANLARLDLLLLKYRDQFATCRKMSTEQAVLDCHSKIWGELTKDLDTLAL